MTEDGGPATHDAAPEEVEHLTDADRLRRARRPHAPRPTSGRFSDADLPHDLPDYLTGQLPRAAATGSIETLTTEDDHGGPAELDDRDRDVFSALVELGVAEDEALAAVLQDRVPLALTRNILEEKLQYTIEEVAERVEVEADTLRKLRAAQGLPDRDLFSKLDIEAAEQFASMLEVFNVETLIRSSRARGNAIGAIVMNDLGVVRDELILPLRRAGADDVTIAIALAEAMRAIEPTARAALGTAYQTHLRHMLTTEIASAATRGTESSMRVAVGFVDIVGFTRLSARIDGHGLDDLIDAFEGRVVEIVSSRPDVAVVKYLGDAVMLIGPDGCTLAEAMLELTQEVEQLADAPVRGGMAVGEVLVRDGDYFGPTVNLAARLTDLTRPWRVLVAEEDIDEVRTQFKVDRIRTTRLRGIGATKPGVVQRPWDDDELAALAAESEAAAAAEG